MKRWMKWFVWPAAVLVLGSSLASGESYHRLDLADLAFDEGQEGLEEALATFAILADVGAIRVPAEAYLGGGTEDGGERQWRWRQGASVVVFRVENEEKIKGWVDLQTNDNGVRGFAFSVDPKVATKCTKEEFEKVRATHYARLRDTGLPGASWFRHRAGDVPVSRNFRWQLADMEDTFALFSGGRAISENLALDRELILGGAADGKQVSLKEIEGITVRPIDWKDRLPDGEVKVDPLSLAIPIDQHAIFFPSLPGMLDLLDRAESEGAPLLQAFSARNPFRTLPTRYRTQMGLDFPDIAARLLPVQSVAVTGGDPFYPLGTDVAVLFETGSAETLFQALLLGIERKANDRKAIAQEWKSEGVEYRGFESLDRSFSSHLMRKGDLVVVANSRIQLERLNAVGNGVAALGASDEFRFFRHRYSLDDEESAFLFLSDAAIRRWCGPEVRIGASRRTRALAALSELSSRAIMGVPLGDEYQSLLGELHVDGQNVRSEGYGSVDFLTPVSELRIDSVSTQEKAAYEAWKNGYERGWAGAFDPIALRLRVSKNDAELDLTVLPLTVGSDYEEMLELAGQAKLGATARTVSDGTLLHFAMAVDRKSELFREFDQELPGLLPGLKVNPLGWVGESISVSLEEDFFWEAFAEVEFDEEMLLQMPVVVRVESVSRLKLAVFLTAVRAAVGTSAPGLLDWEVKKHGKHSYVALTEGEEEELPAGLGIYYAAMPKALLISLDEDLLKKSIDREQAGPDETRTVPLADATQLLLKSPTGFLQQFLELLGETSLEERRREQSWGALAILNEWHRRYPEKDPVDVHLTAFGVDLFCPGGKGYRWNAAEQTMESVAYGHPAKPKADAEVVDIIGKYGDLRAGLEFADGGVRVKLFAGPKPEAKPRKPKAEGKLLSTAKELIPLKEGLVTKFSGSGPEGVETVTVKITKVEEMPDGSVNMVEETFDEAGGEKFYSKAHYRMADGFLLLKSEDEAAVTVWEKPMMNLPAELVEGVETINRFRATSTNEGDGTDVELYFGEERIRVIGLETVKVPAGTYEDCVRIEKLWKGVMGDFYSKDTTIYWYAKGVGVVKYESFFGSERSVYELQEIIEP